MGKCAVRIEGEIDVTAVLRGGVYLLRHRGEIVYVGRGKVMLTRVYSHRTTWGRRRTEAQPKGVLFDEVAVIPCEATVAGQLERELIERFRPRYNKQYTGGLPPDIEMLIAALIPPQAIAAAMPQVRLCRRL